MNPVLADVFEKVKALFIWENDTHQFPDKIDDWQSYADNVEHGEMFSDDCDGFAMTCAELLYRQGINRNDINIAGCFTEDNERHLVCICCNYLLDNRQSRIVEKDDVGYRWVMIMNLGNPGKWERMA